MKKNWTIIRTDKFRVSLGGIAICLLLILVSEMEHYLGLTNFSFISGIKKTGVFLIILILGCLSYSRKYKLEKIIKIFLSFTLVTLISTFLGVTPDISILRQCIHLCFFASIFLAFYFGTMRLGATITFKYIKIPYIIIACIYILAFIGTGISVQNMIYYLALFLPVTSFFSPSIAKEVLYVLQLFLVVCSNKRTALIALVAFFLTNQFLAQKTMTTRKKIFKIILYTIIIVVLYVGYPIILQKLNITVFDEISLANIRQDGGSNRVYIYGQLWIHQMQGGIKHWLIGDGYNSVLLSHICTDGLAGEYVSAHNDFLEVLYDYGIIGIILYIVFLIFMIQRGINMKKKNYKYANAFIGSIVMVIILSMTSHLIIYLNYYAAMFAFWGICLSDYQYFNYCNRKNCQEEHW